MGQRELKGAIVKPGKPHRWDSAEAIKVASKGGKSAVNRNKFTPEQGRNAAKARWAKKRAQLNSPEE